MRRSGMRSNWLVLTLLFMPGVVWAQTQEPPPETAPASRGLFADPLDGLGYRDRAEQLELRLRVLLAGDVRLYDRRNVHDRRARLDRALVGGEGSWRWLAFRVLADLRGTDTRGGLEEAWISLAPIPRLLRFTAGLQRVTPGIENALPEETLPFLDYSFHGFRTGSTDAGLRVDGELLDGLLSWDLFGGLGVGFDLHGQRRAGPQASGKLVTYPFRQLEGLTVELGPYELPLLQGLFLSGAASWQEEFRGRLDVSTSLRNKVSWTRTRLEADGWSFWSIGYGWDLGPFRLIHEFARGSLVGLRGTTGETTSLRGQFTAWSASFAWRITGEPYDSRPYRQRERQTGFPARPLYDPETGAWGPGTIEVSVRYSNTEYDRQLQEPLPPGFQFTGPNESSQEARTLDVALVWWPWRTVRLSAQLTRVIADQRPSNFDAHGRDTSVVLRLQLGF